MVVKPENKAGGYTETSKHARQFPPGYDRPGHDRLPSSLACSRSLNFWILPVEVFGSSVKITVLGHL